MSFSTGRAALHLHIGRNKAGSTTLQAYFLRHAAAMREAGVQYALFNQPSPPGSALPNFATHRDLADFVRAQAGGSVLVSHEGLCCFAPDMMQVMAADLSKLDLQVIFYIRPYTEWIISSYCYDVRTGTNGRDFDSYLEWMWPKISCWPMLEIWGRETGWDRLHVRSLNPLDLQGGDLLSDCLAAIGLPRARTESRSNASPSWIVVELLRLVAGHATSDGWDRTRLAIAEALHELAERAIDDCRVPPASSRYLTRRQAQALAAQYNRDLANLAGVTNVTLCEDNQDRAPERDHLPSAARIPGSILQNIALRALDPEYARLHPEIADFVSSPPFSALRSLDVK